MRSVTYLILGTALLVVGCGQSSHVPAKNTPGPVEHAQSHGTRLGTDLAKGRDDHAQPPSRAPTPPAAPAQTCRVENNTPGPLELHDSAIDESLGVIAPGASREADGHFRVVTSTGQEAGGFCATGSATTVVLRGSTLKLVSSDGKALPEEGR